MPQQLGMCADSSFGAVFVGDPQAAAAVKQQQVVLKRALGNTQQGSGIFPAGMPSPAPTAAAPSAACSQHSTLSGAAAAAVLPSPRLDAARAAAATAASSSSQLVQACAHTAAASSRGGSRGSSQKLQPLSQKLAARIVETCVDQVFAAKAAPNMPDGSFKPVLSLQQAADFEAAGEAANLDRRLERGLVSVHHVSYMLSMMHVRMAAWRTAGHVAAAR